MKNKVKETLLSIIKEITKIENENIQKHILHNLLNTKDEKLTFLKEYSIDEKLRIQIFRQIQKIKRNIVNEYFFKEDS